MKVKAVPADDITRFHGNTELVTSASGKQQMAGLYELNDNFFARYSVTKQAPSEKYILRGQVTLLDPATGTPIRLKKRKKPKVHDSAEGVTDESDSAAPHSRKMTYQIARHTIHLRETDPAAIRKAIAAAAMTLYHNNVLQLVDLAEKTIPIGQMHFSLAVEIFSERYLSKNAHTKEAQHTRLLHLRKVGAYLGQKTISTISLNMVNSVRESIGGNWRLYIKEARDFLEFAYILKGDSDLKNVFATYLEKNPSKGKKSAKKLQMDAANSDALSEAEEQTLMQEILENIHNGIYMGIALLLGTGLPAGEVCSFTWEDIQDLNLYPDAMYVRYRKNEITGATHNYDFPIQGFCVEALRKRKAWLHEQGISDKRMKKLTVASAKGDPGTPLDAKVLTEVSRNILHNFGVGYAQLARNTELQKGAGIAILQKTYDVRLEERCHLNTDAALLCFLQHRSFSNRLQAGYYRCFTDANAIRMIVGSLHRDKQFTGVVTTKRAVRRSKNENGESVTVFPPDSGCTTRCKGQVTLKAGEILEISAPYACNVTAKLVPVETPKKQSAEDFGQEIIETFE